MGKSKELRGLVSIFKPDASPEVPPTHEFQKELCVNIYVPTCKLNLLNHFQKHKLFFRPTSNQNCFYGGGARSTISWHHPYKEKNIFFLKKIKIKIPTQNSSIFKLYFLTY